jgi:hypothetical protein
MQQGRPPPHIRSRLDFSVPYYWGKASRFSRPDLAGGASRRETRIAGGEATYVGERGVRRVFWQRRDLKWHSYEPEPDVDSVEEFASSISEDVELSAAVL